MNIAIFGHSLCMYDPNQKTHFINLLKEHFNANIIHSGIAQCSEERILFNLKKLKNIDLAIVFHSSPLCHFIPAWNRDISHISKEAFLNKITIRDWILDEVGSTGPVDANDKQELDEHVKWFESMPNGSITEVLKHFNIELFNYSDAISKWIDGDYTSVKDLLKEHLRTANEDEDFYLGLVEALEYQKQYLSHPDLQMNRYYGAMVQIDSYLKYKNIPSLHFFEGAKWYPIWHDFVSGPVDKTLMSIRKENSGYYVSYQESANGINDEGNQLMFDTIIEMLSNNAASSIEANAPSDQLGEGGSIPPAAPVKES